MINATSNESAVLSPDQQQALKMMHEGRNVFITGSAGTGKSHLIRQFINQVRCTTSVIGVTATTGAAAVHMGGKTIHSYLGIGLGRQSAAQMASDTASRNKRLAKKIRALKTLVVDEISLMNAELFSKISRYLSLLRKDEKPFGGVQLIIGGDFAQLPPVQGTMCFESEEWQRADITVVKLTTVMRQKGDLEFFNVLERARRGRVNASDLALLRQRKKCSAVFFPEHIVPTKLCCVNCDVDTINAQHVQELIKGGAEAREYHSRCQPGFAGAQERCKAWARGLMIPEKTLLCVGAQVVVTVNVDQSAGLVNGTRGVVCRVQGHCVTIMMLNGATTPIAYHTLTSADDPELKVTFMPLKLAWAVTIHRSQGLTLDAVELDLGSKIFSAGQAYTALSRARDLESIVITQLSDTAFTALPSVVDFYERST